MKEALFAERLNCRRSARIHESGWSSLQIGFVSKKKKESQSAKSKSLRVVLFASRHTALENSMFLGYLLLGLADESIQVALVCPADCDVSSVISPAVEVIRHQNIKLPLLKQRYETILAEKLDKFKPTILHSFSESSLSLTKRLVKRLDLPYVLTVNSLQKRAGRLNISSEYLAKIIVPAESIANNIAELYPAITEKIELVNAGTFVEQAVGCFSNINRVVSLVVAGSLSNAGDFENTLTAMRHLVIAGYKFMVVIIGSGREEPELQKMLENQGLSQITVIVPKLHFWQSVLAAGDIFIRPAPSREFDPLLLKAMSTGTVVAACKGGVDDLIIEDETAVVFDPDNELSIMQSLQKLFDRREFARQIAENAQRYLKQNHTVSNMIGTILNVYHNAENSHKS